MLVRGRDLMHQCLPLHVGDILFALDARCRTSQVRAAADSIQSASK
jgi:hypothetical protein